MIQAGKLKAHRKNDGEFAILPPCTNKYILIGKERMVQVLMLLHPDAEQKMFDDMKLEDLKGLLQWALVLDENCAAPSKIWGELKAGAREPYKELGDNRLEPMIYAQQGDRKVSYVEPDYVAGGCYKKVIGVHNKKRAIVAIKHVGVVADDAEN